MLAGPWLGEVAFELLYWLPFLRWVIAEVPRLREKLIVVSRGGAGTWYHDLAWRTVDLFELFTLDEFRTRWPKYYKQTARFEEGKWQNNQAEAEVIELVRSTIGCERINVLHPCMMYKTFKHIRRVDPHWISTCYRRLSPPFIHGLDAALPSGYVAVRFWQNHSLPTTKTNLTFVRAVVESLAADIPVVLLNTPEQYDTKHSDFPFDLPNTVTVDRFMAAHNNLAVQSAVIGHALAFCGTWGGLSFLPPYYGCPSFGLFSDASAVKSQHILVVETAFAQPTLGDYWAGLVADITPQDVAKKVMAVVRRRHLTHRGE